MRKGRYGGALRAWAGLQQCGCNWFVRRYLLAFAGQLAALAAGKLVRAGAGGGSPGMLVMK